MPGRSASTTSTSKHPPSANSANASSAPATSATSYPASRNAAEATPDGGAIRIQIRDYQSWSTVADQQGQTWVELVVADEGEGMGPKIVRQAAELYFTTRAQGRGLGLSLVQTFARQFNGRMNIETSPGRGTTVRLTFPMADTPELADAAE